MSNAVAQNSPAVASTAKAKTVETVIVTAVKDLSEIATATATKTSTPNLETPFAISVVQDDDFTARGLTDLRDGLRSVPGTEPVGGIGAFNTRFRLRGFATTGHLRNGFRQSVAFPVTEIAGIERIEVLKGPASTLYGRLEPGGAFNIITKQAKPNQFFRSNLLWDEYDRARLGFDANLVIGPNQSIRLNAVYDNGRSFRDDVINETIFGAISYANQISDDTRFVLDIDWLERDGVFDRGFVGVAGLIGAMTALPPTRFLGDPNDSFINETQSVAGRVTHRLTEATEMRVGLAYARTQSDGAYFFPIAGGAGIPILTAGGILNRRNQVTDDGHEDYAAQIDLVSRLNFLGAPQTMLISVDWSQDEASSIIRRATINAPLNINAPIGGAVYSPTTANIVDTLAKNEGLGGVVQLESQWQPWLRTTAGLRVEQVKGRFTDQLTRVTGISKDEAVTPRFGIVILPLSEVSIFANWGRSFNPEAGTRPIIDRPIAEPSQGEQVELGVKWQSAKGRSNAQFSLFQIDKTNIRVGEPAPSPFDRQTGAQRSNGAELEVSWSPTRALHIDSAFTFTDARVRSDRLLAGRALVATPEASASIWGRWDVSDTLGLGLGGTWVGRRFIDPANTLALPPYQRIDAMGTWQVSRQVRLQANLLNVFDKRYFENGNTNNNFYPGQPRTLRLSLSLER